MPSGFRTPGQLLQDAVTGAPNRYSIPSVQTLSAGVAKGLIWARRGKRAIKIKLRNLGTEPVFYLINGDTPPGPIDAVTGAILPPDPLLPNDPYAVPTPKCSASNFHDVLGAGVAADDGLGAQVAFDDTEIKTLSVFASGAGGRVGLIVVLASEAF